MSVLALLEARQVFDLQQPYLDEGSFSADPFGLGVE